MRVNVKRLKKMFNFSVIVCCISDECCVMKRFARKSWNEERDSTFPFHDKNNL